MNIPVVLAQSHCESVEVFIYRVERRDCLDNVVVLFLHTELDLAARVGMSWNTISEWASPVDVG